MRVNFHTHSIVSDGTLSPEALVKKLSKDKVEVFSLTDHDSLEGIEEARKTAEENGIKIINGIEISCFLNGIGLNFLNDESGIHVLGLNFDLELIKEIYKERKKRKFERVKELIVNLKNKGYNLDITENIDKKTVVAKELVNKGYAKGIQEAFNNIINMFYDKHIDNMNIEEAINMIHKANGKVFWAHPFDILNNVSKERIDDSKVNALCGKLRKLGLDGLEVYYQPFTLEQQCFLKKMQEKYGFLASAGTDYHGIDNQLETYLDIDESLIKGVLI